MSEIMLTDKLFPSPGNEDVIKIGDIVQVLVQGNRFEKYQTGQITSKTRDGFYILIGAIEIKCKVAWHQTKKGWKIVFRHTKTVSSDKSFMKMIKA
ncbi:MAG: hypothetical protein DRP52_01075 [Planctomycetota bacterium]|nr:MAG: hypothetical protein DRP52_01075 [Planctomycetota bacterium]